MIKFIRTKECPLCSDIEETLKTLSLAHEVLYVDINAHSILDETVTESKPPLLIDGNEIVQGSKNILKHLEKLEEFKALWDKYQGDSCYCDEFGNIE